MNPPRAEGRDSASAATSVPLKFLLFVLLAVVVAFEVYSPALKGPLVLDDLYMPFGRPDAPEWASRGPWVGGNRPLLQMSFWFNYKLSGPETYSYHVVNVLLHCAVCVAAFFVLRRLLAWTGETGTRRDVAAGFAAGVYLLHPVHAEAVAYITSRSDILSTLFGLGALWFHSWRREREDGASFVTVGVVVVLLAAALLSKEQAAALPAAFLLADYYFRPGFSLDPIRRNWRLHGLVALGGVAALAYVARVLSTADTAGFGGGVGPHQYLVTQGKVIWLYLRLVVLPFGQNVDPDFPLASAGDPAGWAGLGALACLTALAWWKRRSYPLASCGWLLFLALIAPTSSVVPIADVVAERRLYFPFLGLLLIVAQIVIGIARRGSLGRVASAGAMAAVLAAFGYLTSARAAVWGSELALWTDAVEKSPKKMRPRFQLAHALYQSQQCGPAAREYEEASRLAAPTSQLLVDWALALDCAGRNADAVAKVEQALTIERSAHIYATLGMFHGKAGRTDQALDALAKAEQADPRFAMTYAYRGNVYGAAGNWAQARQEFQRALALDPGNPAAAQGLAAAQQALGGR